MIDIIVNSNEAREYLVEKRTSQAIGCHITEEYFQNLFLQNLNDRIDIATDWCCAYDFSNNLKFFFVIRPETSPLDEEIATLLEQDDSVSVWSVYVKNRDVYLKRVLSPNEEVHYNDFKMQYHLTDYGYDPNHAQNCNGNQERQNRINYCNYMDEHHILLPAANNAKIVDYFVSRFFFQKYGDIDYIIKTPIGLNAIELKFKYRAFNNIFGINRLECRTLKDLNDAGIRVYNVILDNNNRLNVLDYINRGPNNAHWLYYRFRDYNEVDERVAPNYTAYQENRPQSYYSFPASHYRLLTYAHNILDLTCPICGSTMILRHRQRDGHEFMGCPNFSINNCTGIINLD